MHDAQISEMTLNEFEEGWRVPRMRLELVPGKEALGAINKHAQEKYGVSITATAIIDAMQSNEIPKEMVELVDLLVRFSETPTRQ